MKEIKLFIIAVKIEAKWVKIKLLKKRKARLTKAVCKLETKENDLKTLASQESRYYEDISGLRDAA